MNRLTESEKTLTTINKGRGPRLAERCLDATHGDPLLALDIACNILITRYGDVISQRMKTLQTQPTSPA